MSERHLQNIARIAFRLSATYPTTDLGNPSDPLDDLIYLILSGQTNEVGYQATFARLKSAFPSWEKLASTPKREIRSHISAGGLARQKAGYIKRIVSKIQKDFGSATLASLSDMSDTDAENYLTSLPGVGIKTARCVLMYTLGRDVFPVDVHCLRILNRVGAIKWSGERADSVADETQSTIPVPLRRSLHIDLIQHGRAVCTAAKPACHKCVLSDLCERSKRNEKPRPTVVDLCCGVGGYSWGFMQAGFDVLLGVDIWQSSLDTYALNIPGAATLKADITNVKVVNEIKHRLGNVKPTVVIAGTPCQGFSRAGPRDPHDERNSLLRAGMRAAVRLRPKIIVFENVSNVRTASFAHHLRKAEGVLRRAGYSFRHAVLNAQSFGVPQTRRRLILVGWKGGDGAELETVLAAMAAKPILKDADVATALAGIDPDKMSAKNNHESMVHSPKVKAKIARIDPGTGPMSYRKLHPQRPASTLICGHRAMPCHYASARTITVREAARIQSFSDDFRFTGPRSHQMQQVVNAVPPKFALGIAMMSRELLEPDETPADQILLQDVLDRVPLRPSLLVVEEADSHNPSVWQ